MNKPDSDVQPETSGDEKPRLPERIAGRYRIKRMLGRGGFGAVYEAWDELDERSVAIKFIRSDATMELTGTRSRTYETGSHISSQVRGDSSRRSTNRTFSATSGSTDDLTEAFKDEFRLLTQLHHPNLAEVFEFGRSEETDGVYFTQELVSGQHLTDLLKTGSRELIVDIFVQLTRALDYLHALGLVHEDIKPTNVLIACPADGPPQAKLIDFGLARVFRQTDKDLSSDDSSLDMVLGAPGFSAPEKVRGELTDHRSDLYSLAATMYAAIRDQRAFPAKNFKEAFSAQMDWRPEFAGVLLSSTGPFVAELIGRMLQPDPNRRPQSARAVVLELLRREASHIRDRYDRKVDLHDFASVLVEHLPFADREGHLGTLLSRAADILLPAEESDTSQSGWNRSLPVQTVVVEAAEGMGKQRLMSELRREIQIGGGLFVEGNCWSADRNALGPYSSIVSQLATALGEKSPLRREYRQLIKLARDSDGSDRSAAGQLMEYLIDCSKERPFVLHLADLSQGQEFARFEQLARAIMYNSASILLCATTVPHSKLTPQLSNLGRELVCEIWHIRPFSLDEMKGIVSGVLGDESVIDELATMLDKLTGGHPLSFRETLRVMIEEQLLVRDAEGWRLRASTASAEELHKSLAQRSEARLDSLGVSAWEIASILYLLEAPIDEAQLAELSDLRKERFRRTLDRLEGEGLIVPTASTTARQVALAHESAREAVRRRYESSLDETRLDLASRIEDLETDDPNYIYLRARLLDEAAEGLESIDSVEEAAKHLFASGHTRLGAQTLQRFITRLRRCGGVENLPRLLKAELMFLRDAGGALDDRDDEARHCEAGVLIAELLSDYRAQSLLWLGLATRYTRYTGDPLDLELALVRLDKAADSATSAQDRELELIIANRRAEVLLIAGQVELAASYSRRAMQILNLPDAKDQDVCDIIGARLRCLAFGGQIEEARRLHRLGAPIAARVPAPQRLGYISGITFAAVFGGDPMMAIPEIEASIQQLRKANAPRVLMAPIHNLGDLYLRLEKYEEAAESFREAIRLATLYGVEHAVHLNRGFLGYTLCRQGDLEEGPAILAEAKEAVVDRFAHDQMILHQLLLLDAEVAHMTGQSARARRELEEMLAEFHAMNEVSLATWAQDALARIERDLGTNFIETVADDGDDSDPEVDTIRTKPVR